MLEQPGEESTLALTAHFPLPSAGWFRRLGDAFTVGYDQTSW